MSKFSNLKLRYKIGVGVATGAAVLAVSGGAFAYFVTNGSSSSSGTVGKTSNANDWGITYPGPNTYSGGADAIYPSITESIPVTVTNNAFGNEKLQTLTAALKTNGSDVATTAGADIPGCLSSWWSVSVTNTGSNFGKDMAAAATDNETVSLTLNDSSTSDQSACESAHPGFTVTAG